MIKTEIWNDLPFVMKGVVALIERIPQHAEKVYRDLEARGRTYQYREDHAGEAASPEEPRSKETMLLDVMNQLGEGLTLSEYSEALGMTHQALARTAGDLVKEGRLDRRDGHYYFVQR